MLETIIVLYGFANLGDQSHVDALRLPLLCTHYMAINANDPNNKVLDEYKACKRQLSSNSMLLAVGEKGLEVLCKLNDARLLDNLSAKIGLSIHQYFPTIQELQFTLDFIAIPELALDANAQKVIQSIPNRVFTVAVPTKNPTPEELQTAYSNCSIVPDLENIYFRDEQDGGNEDEGKPSLTHPYIIVTLPGDAVDTNGEMKYFTQASAQELFESIRALREAHGNKHTIIVQNSPRTGKFNPETGNVECAHEYQAGMDPKLAIDKISHFFVNLLHDNNIPYHFYNFAFEIQGAKRTKKSVYEPLLYVAMSNSNNYFIVPGESVTMLGQIPVYLRAKQAILFEPSSMNPTHTIIANRIKFDSEKGKGYLSHFEKRLGKIEVSTPYPAAQEPMQDDATLVKNGIRALSMTNQYANVWASIRMLGQWAEVLAASLVAEAARRDYITPVQAMVACVPLVGVYMYRHHMTSADSVRSETSATGTSCNDTHGRALGEPSANRPFTL